MPISPEPADIGRSVVYAYRGTHNVGRLIALSVLSPKLVQVDFWTGHPELIGVAMANVDCLEWFEVGQYG